VVSRLAERYRRHYARSDDVSRAYRAALRDRLHELRRAAGIADTGTFDM
jgi:hypothetical protein